MTIGNIFYLYEKGGRKNQEDFIWPPAGTATLNDRIFIACDGVGGLENGEIASRVIAESVGAALSQLDLQTVTKETINRLLLESRNELQRYASAQQLSRDMATTFTLLILLEGKAFLAWCGDSRIYHFRSGQILYRTADHSLVNSLVQKGELSEKEALHHPQKHLILKAVKLYEANIDAETHLIDEVKPGDLFLLCTDGLLENLTDEELASLIGQYQSREIEIEESLQQFCHNKTRDNYSMYLLETSHPGYQNGSPKKKTSLLFLFLLLGVGALFGYIYKSNSNSSTKTESAASGTDMRPAESVSTEVTVTSTGSGDSLESISPSKSFYDSLEVIRKRAVIPVKKIKRDSFINKSPKQSDD